MTSHKKPTEGGDATTAGTHYDHKVTPFCTRIKAAIVRFAALLATLLRGLG